MLLLRPLEAVRSLWVQQVKEPKYPWDAVFEFVRTTNRKDAFTAASELFPGLSRKQIRNELFRRGGMTLGKLRGTAPVKETKHRHGRTYNPKLTVAADFAELHPEVLRVDVAELFDVSYGSLISRLRQKRKHDQGRAGEVVDGSSLLGDRPQE